MLLVGRRWSGQGEGWAVRSAGKAALWPLQHWSFASAIWKSRGDLSRATAAAALQTEPDMF